jgi:hypothetical protein
MRLLGSVYLIERLDRWCSGVTTFLKLTTQIMVEQTVRIVRGWLPAQYTGMLESSEGPRLALFQCLFYKNHQLAFSALVSTSSRVLTRNTLNTIGTKQNAFYCH